MTDETIPAVRLGDRTHHLQSFKAFKAAHVAAIIASIADEAQAIAEAYRTFKREYGEKHRTKVPESVAVVRGWDVPESHWIRDEEDGERYILLPAVPSEDEAILAVFGKAQRLAKTEVQRLLALLVVSNDALADAEDDSPEAVDALLDREGKGLMRAAETWELIDLLAAAQALVTRELTSRAEKMGKLRELTGWRATTPSSEPPPQPVPTETAVTPTSETPMDDSSGLSTISAPLTAAGPVETSSIAPAIASS